MATLTAVLITIGIPAAALILLLKATDVLYARRDARIARQVEVTEAIHREFGAIVAPFVRRTRGGWRVTLTLDPRHPCASRIVELIAHTLGPTATVEVAVAAAPSAAPRRPGAQKRERIASAMSA
jgi:hypothetical protein